MCTENVHLSNCFRTVLRQFFSAYKTEHSKKDARCCATRLTGDLVFRCFEKLDDLSDGTNCVQKKKPNR